MATIYKRRETRPIPEGATIGTYRGKPCATWTDARGKTQRAELNAAGDRIIRTADTYTAQYFDADGKRRKAPTGAPDKATAERIAARIESEVAERRRGLIDPAAERIANEARRPIPEHLAGFEAMMNAARRDPKHIKATTDYIKRLTAAAGWQVIGDIDADAVNVYVAELLAAGKSARLAQATLTAAKSFTRWLAKHGKLTSDPLAAVAKPNPAADRRHERRMLLPEEWDWLRTTTADGPDRFNMTGPERMLLYAVAIQTGLRSGELRSLTRGRLFLDGPQPYVTCKARTTKNSKDCKQYILADTAAELAMHAATKAPAAPLFKMPDTSNVSRMFRADLQASRQAWLQASRGPDERLQREQSDFLTPMNHDGERLDFHALRHTCGAWLAKAGVHPKIVQTVMRHSTITLTMDTYGHLFPGQTADAVAALAGMMTTATDTPPAARLATGTDGPRDR